ncbi:putative DEAD/DEAH box helicase [Aspergillus brunneoviolaceus CBS 621.78]|uniref:P-loop containing nucleoside triphosphate hydrolase protein n=1 Tax=Aspergillus brunneoviolaceus CBS 621.78 TaxID=1450534 RepID=A0ACD1GPB4_9EURO|nr:P-loop containing nucleoside triphosphate hydrolase protein [Aspergillus brunneoviolaceus CBS 621.78]RAH51209.1 P-loop containing nucleoside triphosphate hydrolase protein [Aspergillus brunneoviolaceus CBS 621.78]
MSTASSPPDDPNWAFLFKGKSLSSPRTIDLIGDYAGDELFILEGDSLLRHCFSDDLLDFDLGFQLLHATYIVERFLAQLHQRKCHFHIVFFSSHSEACIPQHSSADNWSKYRLAREVILQHMSRHLPETIPSMHIRCFEGYDCKDFDDYLVATRAYFIMCHDGEDPAIHHQPCAEKAENSDALYMDDEEKHNISGLDDENPSGKVRPETGTKPNEAAVSNSATFRSFISWSLSRGYTVSLINSLEFRDTKVISTILEGLDLSGQQSSEDQDVDSKSVHDMISQLSSNGEKYAANMCHPGAVFSSTVSFPVGQPSERIKKIFRRIYETVPRPSLSQREWAVVFTLSALGETGKQRKKAGRCMEAMLLHTAVLSECRLCDRPCQPDASGPGADFLRQYNDMALAVLQSPSWQEFTADDHVPSDLIDMIDGRIFLGTLNRDQNLSLAMLVSPTVVERYNLLVSTLNKICAQKIAGTIMTGDGVMSADRQYQEHTLDIAHSRCKSHSNILGSVMPFSNPILDKHLGPISLDIVPSAVGISSSARSKPFTERTHWHNARRPLDVKQPAAPPQKIQSRYQRLMRDIRQYALSLTDATGGILQPEKVFRESKGIADRRLTRNQENTRRPTGPNPSSEIQDKQLIFIKKQTEVWQDQRRCFDKEPSLAQRYVNAKSYLEGLPEEKRCHLEAEVLTYLISTLVGLWRKRCFASKKSQSMHIVALIWHTILQITKVPVGVTKDIIQCISKTSIALGLPEVNLVPHGNQSLTFEFAFPGADTEGLHIGLSFREFQLLHAGPFLDRNMESALDSRVRGFAPDRWQREILDQIDAKASLFVVAPTSAGKTFISFYAIKQVLQDSDDGVLVYVAPTKALVNQVAAEIEARFTKTYKHAGKSVWAIHTRDTRVNNPTKCQVLITVPHILQIMLLAPGNAKSWSSRIKRIIFDEVHCIGQADDGVVWEQLLLLAPCPIVALSATVGNPKEFSDWLSLTQRANGFELKTVEHKVRWSDLRKYIYRPPASFNFDGLPGPAVLPVLGLDGCADMEFIHPVTSLIDRSRGIPDDLSLEPRDCLKLWQAMVTNQTKEFALDASLSPSAMMPEIMTKADVFPFEARLKAVLASWMRDRKSPFDAVVQELSENALSNKKTDVHSSSTANSHHTTLVGLEALLNTTLPLIYALSEQGALPALFFNYDRSWCEKICHRICSELQNAERSWKESDAEWKSKLARFQAWKKSSSTRAKKATSHNADKVSRADRLREAASEEPDWYASFDPDEPLNRFSLANGRAISKSDFETYAAELESFDVPDRFIDALRRGVGVHHAGMNRKYRNVCEILFRKGFLRVVIATGTLALGINMPCKTVVFAGDSVFLTALNFRQSAGRAGRRGFDYLGNIVFQDISGLKVRRLMSSKLPDLNGHFPITTSLVLRLCILLHESDQAILAKKVVDSILSSPRIYLGGPESRQTVLHHLRFSIDYLRRNQLLDETGVPLNFAGAISHLYYTENSSFALHSLLKAGYFHRLSKHLDENPERTLRTLMVVMSHLFGRRPLHPFVIKRHLKRHKQSTSVVVLPPLPRPAERILRHHNRETLDIYSTYVATFVDQHLHNPDDVLPLTKLKQGGTNSISQFTARDNRTRPAVMCPTQAAITSAFVALSCPDPPKTIAHLCKSVRQGVWLEQSVIPHVPVESDGEAGPLNAYLYDFFKHGNKSALDKENMIRRGDLWFLLNDFSLILATIVTSLENFLKSDAKSSVGEPDDLGVMGCGDAQEEEDEVDSMAQTVLPRREKNSVDETGGKTVFAADSEEEVPDSWEDMMDDETKSNADTVPAGLDETLPIDHDQQGQGEVCQQMESVFDQDGLQRVLEMFQLLRTEFNAKFKKMWA